ncbi:hypothetical protein [Allosalinactinospora lopnorensis]|uniref:hypothetical protein n=1 Tax=Allosalinactinospora lopnorensis TaxID=1352348 RepID=UPI000623E130|nr:hypothetical protein [Allosalinactinospora lopnorensis]
MVLVTAASAVIGGLPAGGVAHAAPNDDVRITAHKPVTKNDPEADMYLIKARATFDIDNSSDRYTKMCVELTGSGWAGAPHGFLDFHHHSQEFGQEEPNCQDVAPGQSSTLVETPTGQGLPCRVLHLVPAISVKTGAWVEDADGNRIDETTGDSVIRTMIRPCKNAEG